MKTTLAVAALALLLSGCGGEGDTRAEPSQPARAPATPPPDRSGGPPPAWLETESGSFWLGGSTYCWGEVCADYAGPSCGAGGAPAIPVRPGERVRIHLGFRPRDVDLIAFLPRDVLPNTASTSLRGTEWVVTRGGPFSWFVLPEPGQGGADASYVACLEVDGQAADPRVRVDEAVGNPPEAPVVVEGMLLAEGGSTRLCDGLAESHPPQCAEPSLTVTGLDLGLVPERRRAGGVTWTDTPVAIFGVVEDGVLRVGRFAAP